MILLSTLLVLAAVLLLLPGAPPTRWTRADGWPGAGIAAPAGRRLPGGLLPALGLMAGGLICGALLDGVRGVVLGAAVALVVATTARLLLLRQRRRAVERTAAAVVEGCAVLAANLRVGQVPSQALGTAADSCPLLRPAHETLLLGGDVTLLWRRQAAEPGAGGLRELARAWQVAARTGASLGSTLEQVALGQSADQALRSVVGSELAAPRATGKLMAALPLLGLGMGYLLGGDPVGWLTAGAAGWSCMLLGVTLACAGVLWIEALARRASVQD